MEAIPPAAALVDVKVTLIGLVVIGAFCCGELKLQCEGGVWIWACVC